MEIVMISVYLAIGMWSWFSRLGCVSNYFDSYKMKYLILPTICMILCLCFLKWFKNIEPLSRNRDKKLALLWAFYFAAIMIVIEMAAGIFIDELGRNPYDL